MLTLLSAEHGVIRRCNYRTQETATAGHPDRPPRLTLLTYVSTPSTSPCHLICTAPRRRRRRHFFSLAGPIPSRPRRLGAAAPLRPGGRAAAGDQVRAAGVQRGQVQHGGHDDLGPEVGDVRRGRASGTCVGDVRLAASIGADGRGDRAASVATL